MVALGSSLPDSLAVQIGDHVQRRDKGPSEGFVVDFDGPAARDAYLADPQHQKTGARIVDNAVGGLDGILVYDIEIADQNS